jgi:hypothetical protein
MWSEGGTEGTRNGEIRVKEAVALGAKVLATSCPFCLLTLEDAVKIFESVSVEKWEGLSKRLLEITGWLRFLPEDLMNERGLLLSTFLGRIATPPKSKEELAKKLARCRE